MGNMFVFGSLFFFILIFVVGIILIVATELEDQNSWLFLTIPITIVLLYWGGNSQTIKDWLIYITENRGQIIIFVILYLLIGTIWSFVKWYLYLVEMRDHYNTYGSSSYYRDNYSLNQNKERILNWMIYWPLSAFWTMINHPVRKMFKLILKNFAEHYQSISDKVFKDLNNKKGK
jgi:hypothetical protein